MLKEFGALVCPSCGLEMVQVCEVGSEGAEPLAGDQRWLCGSCGYSRPVIFRVERPGRLEGRASGHVRSA